MIIIQGTNHTVLMESSREPFESGLNRLKKEVYKGIGSSKTTGEDDQFRRTFPELVLSICATKSYGDGELQEFDNQLEIAGTTFEPSVQKLFERKFISCAGIGWYLKENIALHSLPIFDYTKKRNKKSLKTYLQKLRSAIQHNLRDVVRAYPPQTNAFQRSTALLIEELTGAADRIFEKNKGAAGDPERAWQDIEFRELCLAFTRLDLPMFPSVTRIRILDELMERNLAFVNHEVLQRLAYAIYDSGHFDLSAIISFASSLAQLPAFRQRQSPYGQFFPPSLHHAQFLMDSKTLRSAGVISFSKNYFVINFDHLIRCYCSDLSENKETGLDLDDYEHWMFSHQKREQIDFINLRSDHPLEKPQLLKPLRGFRLFLERLGWRGDDEAWKEAWKFSATQNSFLKEWPTSIRNIFNKLRYFEMGVGESNEDAMKALDALTIERNRLVGQKLRDLLFNFRWDLRGLIGNKSGPYEHINARFIVAKATIISVLQYTYIVYRESIRLMHRQFGMYKSEKFSLGERLDGIPLHPAPVVAGLVCYDIIEYIQDGFNNIEYITDLYSEDHSIDLPKQMFDLNEMVRGKMFDLRGDVEGGGLYDINPLDVSTSSYHAFFIQNMRAIASGRDAVSSSLKARKNTLLVQFTTGHSDNKHTEACLIAYLKADDQYFFVNFGLLSKFQELKSEIVNSTLSGDDSPAAFEETKAALKTMGDTILTSIENCIGKKSLDNINEIAINECGELFGIPWAALIWHDSYLIESFLIKIVPNFHYGQSCDSFKLHKESKFLHLSSDSQDLRFVASENKHLEEAFGSQYRRLDSQHSIYGGLVEGSVGLQQARMNLVHFTGHGVYDSNNPSRSEYVLPDDSFRLNGHQLHLPTYKNVGLVFLNICESGRHTPVGQADFIGLDAPFYMRMVPNIVHCLWPVRDEFATQFSRVFYRYLLAGESPACALRSTQLELAKDESEKPLPEWACYKICSPI